MVSRVVALLFLGPRHSTWGGGQPHVPAVSTPEKTQYPLYRRLGGTQSRSGRVENIVSTWIRSRIVQPVVSRYTD